MLGSWGAEGDGAREVRSRAQTAVLLYLPEH